MVLILSNSGDLSCDIVQDWLEFYKHPYLRINAWDFLYKPISISLVKGKLSLWGKRNRHYEFFLDRNCPI